MEMDKFQTIFHFLFLDKIESLKQFTGGQSEFTCISSTFFPFTTARRSQLYSDSDIGTYIQLLGKRGNQTKFIQLFNNQENTLTHLLRQQSQFYIAFILIAVTNDQRIRIRINGNHSMKFGF